MKDQNINALSSELSSTVMRIRKGIESNINAGKVDLSPLKKEIDKVFDAVMSISKIAADDSRSAEMKEASGELQNIISEVENLQKFVMQGIRKMWGIN